MSTATSSGRPLATLLPVEAAQALAQRKPGELSPYIAPENLNTYRIGLKCFFEEGRALASIYHPNIVRVIDFGIAEHHVYMIMELVSGHSLRDELVSLRQRILKNVGQLSLETTLFGQKLAMPVILSPVRQSGLV